MFFAVFEVEGTEKLTNSSIEQVQAALNNSSVSTDISRATVQLNLKSQQECWH